MSYETIIGQATNARSLPNICSGLSLSSGLARSSSCLKLDLKYSGRMGKLRACSTQLTTLLASFAFNQYLTVIKLEYINHKCFCCKVSNIMTRSPSLIQIFTAISPDRYCIDSKPYSLKHYAKTIPRFHFCLSSTKTLNIVRYISVFHDI